MDSKLLETLVIKRIFPITEKIGPGLIADMKEVFFRMALQDQKSEANLIIDSGGGGVLETLTGYDLIRSLPFDTNGTVIGRCDSSALTLIAACKKRTATKHSRFTFHAMSYSPIFKSTQDLEIQMQKSLHEHTILFQQVMKIQSSAFNISEEDILKMRRDGEDFNVKLTAYEAMEKGIIHEIVEKPLFSF